MFPKLENESEESYNKRIAFITDLQESKKKINDNLLEMYSKCFIYNYYLGCIYESKIQKIIEQYSK
jgi:hypothetical protein